MGDDGKSVVEEDWRIWSHSQIPQCCLAPATTSSQHTTLPLCRGSVDFVFRRRKNGIHIKSTHHIVEDQYIGTYKKRITFTGASGIGHDTLRDVALSAKKACMSTKERKLHHTVAILFC